MASKLENMGDVINCSICLNVFTQPKTITCGHQFCVICLEDYVTKISKTNTFPCPLCRHDNQIPLGGIKSFPSSVDVDNTGSDVLMIPTIDDTGSDDDVSSSDDTGSDDVDTYCDVNTFTCNFCTKDVTSGFWCDECQKLICDSCRQPHDVLFSGHRLVDARDYVTKFGVKFCSQHKSDKLDYYCQDCCVVICFKCLMATHKDHETPQLADYDSEARQELGVLSEEINTKLNKFGKHVDNVNDQICKMNESMATSCSNIAGQVKQICDAATNRGGELRQQLENIRVKEETRMKTVVSDTNNMIKPLAEFTENIKAVMIGQSPYHVVDALPSTRSKHDHVMSLTLPILDDVRSEFAPGCITVEQMVGNVTTWSGLCYKYNLDTTDQAEDTWFYSPALKLKKWPFYIRHRYTTYPDDKRDTYLDLGVLINIGEDGSNSINQPCNVDMCMTVRRERVRCRSTTSSHKTTLEFNKNSRQPFYEHVWKKVDNAIYCNKSYQFKVEIKFVVSK